MPYFPTGMKVKSIKENNPNSLSLAWENHLGYNIKVNTHLFLMFLHPPTKKGFCMQKGNLSHVVKIPYSVIFILKKGKYVWDLGLDFNFCVAT